MKYSVVGVENPRWTYYTNRSACHDFYHTADFHRIDSAGIGTPEMFVFEVDGAYIAIPMILRRISGSDFSDAVSAYGYPGHLSSGGVMTNSFINDFELAFRAYCDERRLVSVFLRLHPMAPADNFFESFGQLVNGGTTCSIDLRASIENQVAGYRKNYRREIRSLRADGFTVEFSKSQSAVEEFGRIYRANMDRLNAAASYYYPEQYFVELVKAEQFDAFIATVRIDGAVAAAALLTSAGGIQQYHLGGTDAAYLQKAPMKLLLDEARLLAVRMGLEHFHLGGGRGGAEDSLYQFKAGFTKISHRFRVWRFIADQRAYESICRDRNIDHKYADYFPAYRSEDRR